MRVSNGSAWGMARGPTARPPLGTGLIPPRSTPYPLAGPGGGPGFSPPGPLSAQGCYTHRASSTAAGLPFRFSTRS